LWKGKVREAIVLGRPSEGAIRLAHHAKQHNACTQRTLRSHCWPKRPANLAATSQLARHPPMLIYSAFKMAFTAGQKTVHGLRRPRQCLPAVETALGGVPRAVNCFSSGLEGYDFIVPPAGTEGICVAQSTIETDTFQAERYNCCHRAPELLPPPPPKLIMRNKTPIAPSAGPSGVRAAQTLQFTIETDAAEWLQTTAFGMVGH